MKKLDGKVSSRCATTPTILTTWIISELGYRRARPPTTAAIILASITALARAGFSAPWNRFGAAGTRGTPDPAKRFSEFASHHSACNGTACV